MAYRIAVMSAGRIEQLGTPDELYEQPRTAFVANFLGVSNLLSGTVVEEDGVRLGDGTIVRVPPRALAGRSGVVAVGIRPEKIELGGVESNTLAGAVAERAYVGVATQYIVETTVGSLTLYVQNAGRAGGGLTPGERVTIRWSPESTFVVDATGEAA